MRSRAAEVCGSLGMGFLADSAGGTSEVRAGRSRGGGGEGAPTSAGKSRASRLVTGPALERHHGSGPGAEGRSPGAAPRAGLARWDSRRAGAGRGRREGLRLRPERHRLLTRYSSRCCCWEALLQLASIILSARSVNSEKRLVKC